MFSGLLDPEVIGKIFAVIILEINKVYCFGYFFLERNVSGKKWEQWSCLLKGLLTSVFKGSYSLYILFFSSTIAHCKLWSYVLGS